MRSGQSMASVARMQRLRLFISALCALLLTTSSVVQAAPASQVAATAPENLRCQLSTPPPSPGPGWQVVPVWEWQDLFHVDSPRGSSDGPYAVAVDHDCNIYLTDAEHFQVLKLDRGGVVMRSFKMPDDRAPGESSSPRGVAVDNQGNVYATDTPRDRIVKFSPRGEVVAVWGECDHATEANHFCDTKQPGRFISPEGIAIDGAGHVFVAEVAGKRLQRMTLDGKPEAVWDLTALGDLSIPGTLSVDQGGFVYMAEAFNNQVVKFDPGSGKLVGKWGGQRGSEPGQFHNPLGVGVDLGGNMYVSDQDNWRVQKLAPDGAFLDQWRYCIDGDPPCNWPDAGDQPGQFFASRGITLDAAGSVYVADTANKRLQRFVIVDYELIPPLQPDDDAAAG